jgi:protein SCO1/2
VLATTPVVAISDDGKKFVQRSYAILAGATVVLFLVVSAGVVYLGPRGDQSYAHCRGGQVAGDIGGPFTLINRAGVTVTDKDVITKPSLVYFGYTFCPDVCPLDSARNAEAVDILAGMGHDVTPVFISFDPERDTPEVLTQFTDFMHPKMVGLTGSIDQVRAATKAYRVYFAKQATMSEELDYLMDHSAFSYLVLPGEGFVDFFRRELTAQQVAERVSCFVEIAEGI